MFEIYPTILLLWIWAVLQLFLMMGKNIFNLKVLIIFISWLIVFFIGTKDIETYNINMNFLIYIIFVISSIWILFKDKILNNIWEDIIFIISLLLIYMFINLNLLFPYLLVPIIVLVLYNIYLISTNRSLTEFEKLFLYIFYMLFLITLGVSQIFDFINNVLGNSISKRIIWYDLITKWMIFTMIILNLCYIYNILPIPQKGEKSQDMVYRVWEMRKTLVWKFSNNQLPFKFALIIGFSIAVLMILNYKFKFISDMVFVNIIYFWYINISLFFINLNNQSIV